MVFLDGVGIGEPNPESNPFYMYDFRYLSAFFNSIPGPDSQEEHSGNKIYFPVDARLGMDGLPQSGTGQVSLLCGVNGAEYIGKHFGPFPYSLHHDLIREQNLFAEVIRSGKTAEFVNAYPKIFFDFLGKQKRRIGTFALSALYSGIKLKNLEDLRNGRGLSNDITNIRWQQNLGYKINTVEPETAAKRLLRISRNHSFTAFEYFLTDHIGHGRIKDDLPEIFSDLDRFLLYLLNNHDEDTLLVIVSDHGNFENIAVKTHTLNPVLCVVSGKEVSLFRNKITSLTDFKGAILEYLKN